MTLDLATKLLLSEANVEQLVKDKRVLLRVDFNVPVDSSSGEITSDLRIRAALPTIDLILGKGGAKCVIVASHMGRPGGKREEKSSLRPVAKHLESLSGRQVYFMEHPFGPLASSPQPSPSPLSATASTAPLVLLENLRFYPEEEASDKSVSGEQVRAFASSLAALADVYVNDAFGTAHRAHASMVAVAECFETRAAGLLMGEELRNFAKVLNGSQSGSVLCIVGGAKVADKIALLNNLLEKCDSMIICGGMAFTFLNVLHHRRIGKSLFDEQSIEEVKRIEEKAKKSGKRLILPVDFVTAKSFDATETFNCEGDIPDDMMGLDCGEKSREIFASAIAESETILWNGPPGVFEKPQFEAGSLAMLKAVCDNKKAVKVAGGGDTTSLVIKYKRESDFDLVSTGGGASLELLEGKTLPGVAALSDIK